MIGYSLLSLFVFAVDMFSKRWALSNCSSEVFFNKFLSCKLVFNRGVICSLFHSMSEWQFSLVTILVIGVLLFLGIYAGKKYALGIPIWGEILVLSGGFSNVFDRFIYGGVVDFIVLGYKNYSWPVFNFADFVVVCGVFLMLLGSCRRK